MNTYDDGALAHVAELRRQAVALRKAAKSQWQHAQDLGKAQSTLSIWEASTGDMGLCRLLQYLREIDEGLSVEIVRKV